jgi:hypothetical protein
MLTVSVKVNDLEVAIVEIKNVQTNEDGTANYVATFEVDRMGARGRHRRRLFGFPRTQYNALGLLKLALDSLDPRDLELETDGTGTSDLARRQRGAGPALPR